MRIQEGKKYRKVRKEIEREPGLAVAERPRSQLMTLIKSVRSRWRVIETFQRYRHYDVNVIEYIWGTSSLCATVRRRLPPTLMLVVQECRWAAI